MNCPAKGRSIEKIAIAAALGFCLLTVEAPGQDRNGSVPQRPRYGGPPASIDGPEPLPVPSAGLSAPSDQGPKPGQPVLVREGDIGEPLMLPGGTIEDALPPDWLLEEPPRQKLSAYKSGFFQKLSLQADW